MGTWSTSITGNDTAMDLRTEYTCAFYYYDVPTALEKLETYANENIDEDEWCDYYYSLADFMWKKGILTEEVKNRAVEMINTNFGLDLWEDSGEKTLAKRKAVLEKFKAQLLSPMPPRKKIRPNLYLNDIFENGDIIAIKLQTKGKTFAESKIKDMTDDEFHALDGKYILIQKISCHIVHCCSVVPEVADHWAIFRLFDGLYDKTPESVDVSSLREANFLNSHTRDYRAGRSLFLCESSMFYFRKRQYKVICNDKKSIEKYRNVTDCDRSIFFSVNHDTKNTDSYFAAAIGNEISI